MIRFSSSSSVVAFALTLSVISAGPTHVRAQAPAASPAVADATPDNAAVFLGDWTLSTSGSNGPDTTALSIKAAAGKVTAELASDAQGRIAITDIKKRGTALVLSYGFDYQGMAVPVVVTLTPAAEKVTAEFDFAGGAYQMSGTATKK